MSGVEFCRRLRERERYTLIFGDLRAECLSLLCIIDRHFQRPSSLPDRPRGVVDAAERHSIQRDLESLIDLADELPRMNFDVLKHQRALMTSDVTKQAHNALDGKTL